jgi:hypothetical protein
MVKVIPLAFVALGALIVAYYVSAALNTVAALFPA